MRRNIFTAMHHFLPVRRLALLFCFAAAFIILPRDASAVVTVAFPTTIDSDIIVRATGPTTTPWTNVVAEGWLHLTRTSIESEKFTGTFTDNLGGGKTYAASAEISDVENPTVTITNRYGKFVFKMDLGLATDSFASNGTLSSPSKLKLSNAFLAGMKHAFLSREYALYVDLQFGYAKPNAQSFGNPTLNQTLTLSVIIDANKFLVPRDPFTKEISKLIIGTNNTSKVFPLTSPGLFQQITSNGSAAGYMSLNIPYFGRYLALNGQTSNDGVNYDGSATIAGKGSAAVIGQFNMGQPQN